MRIRCGARRASTVSLRSPDRPQFLNSRGVHHIAPSRSSKLAYDVAPTPMSVSLVSRMGPIFVNYRREDAEGDAGRLHAELTRLLPGVRVFMDVENLRAARTL